MEWNELYTSNIQPTFEDINEFINSDLLEELNIFIKQNYDVLPELSYSMCSGQPGWNVKYKKSGKSLCTLYPMENFFIALVVIGNKEVNEAELMLPAFTQYIQNLYKNTPYSLGGKWLMINVTDKNILENVKDLIKIRVVPKVKK